MHCDIGHYIFVHIYLFEHNLLISHRPVLAEFKTTEDFEVKRLKSDVFFLFVRDENETSEEYEVCLFL